MAGRIFVGTSGWNYAGWKEKFYAGVPRKAWLEFYAERLNALEVDGTFYHMMRPSVFQSWRDRTPDHFRFAIKGHRYITHLKRLDPPRQSMQLQRENSAALGKKLVAVLWQLPATMHRDVARLEHFAALLDMWPEVRHVIEFRHKSWFDSEVADVMARERLSVCQSDAATWPMWEAVTTDMVFVRLHGHTATYSSNYTDRSLGRWACRVRKWVGEKRDVHVYFDNDAKGYAPFNALTLVEMLSLKANVKRAIAETNRGQRRNTSAKIQPTRTSDR